MHCPAPLLCQSRYFPLITCLFEGAISLQVSVALANVKQQLWDACLSTSALVCVDTCGDVTFSVNLNDFYHVDSVWCGVCCPRVNSSLLLGPLLTRPVTVVRDTPITPCCVCPSATITTVQRDIL